MVFCLVSGDVFPVVSRGGSSVLRAPPEHFGAKTTSKKQNQRLLRTNAAESNFLIVLMQIFTLPE